MLLLWFLPRVFHSFLLLLSNPPRVVPPPDIDECTLPTTCPRGTCTNTEGSFTCVTCQPGFRASEDGQGCEGEAAFVQECAFVAPNRCAFARLPPLEIAYKGERAAVNGIRCKRYRPRKPPPPYLCPKSKNTSSRHHIIVGSWTPPPLAPFIPSLHNTMRHWSSNRKKNDVRPSVCRQLSSKDRSVDIL